MDGRRWAESILLSSAYNSKTTDAHRGYERREYGPRKKKYFSPEEKAKILSRVKMIGITDAAREANTWPNVIERWIKEMDREPAETVAAKTTVVIPEVTEATPANQAADTIPAQEIIPEKEDTSDKEETQEIMENTKRTKDFTPEERENIIARARKVGAIKAAEEAGTVPQVISGWMARGKKKKVKSEPVKKAEPMESMEPVKKSALVKNTIDFIPGENGLPAKRDDSHTYTAEEREILVKKADEVGRVKIQNAYGLKNYTLRDWARVVKRRAGMMRRAGKTEEKQIADIIPGENGLPEKRTTPYTYTAEERKLLVAKAAEVGKAKVRKAYGLRENTLYDWEVVIRRQEKRAAAQARVDEKMMKATPVITPTVVPGENGLPSKRDNPSDYTKEERRLIVEKANEVGNPAVKKAYGFKYNYTIHDWRRVVERQKAKKATVTTEKPAETAQVRETAPESIITPVSIPTDVPEPQVHETLKQPEEAYKPDGSYSSEVQIILLREQVVALTERIEKLRKAIAALMGTVL